MIIRNMYIDTKSITSATIVNGSRFSADPVLEIACLDRTHEFYDLSDDDMTNVIKYIDDYNVALDFNLQAPEPPVLSQVVDTEKVVTIQFSGTGEDNGREE